MIDKTDGKLNDAIRIARQRRDLSLIRCLKHLRKVDEYRGTSTVIMPDFAPLSFYFVRYYGDEFAGNGGIIFHGSHDGYGSGSAPTFSVTLEPTNGWAIHT